MMKSENITKWKEKIVRLETRVKQLSNELNITKKEYRTSTDNYFDLLSNLEEKMHERTSELKNAKRILEAKGRELQIMLDLSPAMILYKDKNHRYIRVNINFAEILGISMKKVIGKTHADLFPESTGQILDDDAEVLEKGESVLNKTGMVRTPAGMKSILVDKIPYKDIDGEVVGIIGFVQDLTEFEKAEKEKKELQERIVRAEKMEAIGLLAGGFAHDSNNILGGITGYIQLAMMNMPEDDQNQAYLNSSLDAVNKMAELVQDLLTLARRGVSNSTVLNLNAVVTVFSQSSVFEKLKSQHPEVRIEMELEPDLLNMTGKPVHLDKTLMNLVTNAAEALPDGGLVTVSTRNQYVDRPINGYDLSIEEGEFIVLRVADNGTGIAPSDINRIFEPFYTKKVMGKSGTGLGMSVVYGTVKDHHGFIDVHSRENIGTTFELFLPVTREMIVPEKETAPIETYMGNGQKVLVVDDVSTQRDIASEILAKLGYCVTAVASGEEAVVHIKDNPADILVLDMIMPPGIDGLATYRQIIELYPSQKAIITSGFSASDRVKACQRLGAGQYVQKPYTFEKIGSAIKKELAKPFMSPN